MVKAYMGVKNHNGLAMIADNKGMCGYHLGHLTSHPQIIVAAVEELIQLYRDGKFKPQIDSVWSFQDVSRCHRYLSMSVYLPML